RSLTAGFTNASGRSRRRPQISNRSLSPPSSAGRSAASVRSLSRPSVLTRLFPSEDSVSESTVANVGLTREEGYSMIELLVSMIVLMTISGTVMGAVLRMSRTNQTVANRSEMHAGVRNVTELLQQEVGQAGRITIPSGMTLATSVDTATLTATGLMEGVNTNFNASSLVYQGMQLVVDTGEKEETVTLTNASSANNQVTAFFFNHHDAGVPVN